MNKKLILNCKKLNRRAQREMVNHLSPFLFPICRRYSSSFEDSKDLLQESLILIFNNMEKCVSKEVVPFKSWCKKITINHALGELRKQTRQIVPVTNITIPSSITPNIYSKLNIEDILKLLQMIPESHSTVFKLAIVDGYNHKEIANLLDIKESSSRTFLVRARQTLQKLIQKQENYITSKEERITGR